MPEKTPALNASQPLNIFEKLLVIDYNRSAAFG